MDWSISMSFNWAIACNAINLDWTLLSNYGKKAIDIYWSIENMILPLAFGILVSLIYWTLTIQLYKKSYTTYLCINKKEEIYGK